MQNTNEAREKIDYGIAKSIALIGMPGTFKSTVGKLLAKKIGFTFCDTDHLYETKYGLSIPATFATVGEEVFRERESIVVHEAASKQKTIIATGGGVVLRQDNVDALKQACTVVQLCAHVYTIFARIRNSNARPLLKDITIEKLSSMYQGRANLYTSAADFKIVTDGKQPKHIVEYILKKLSPNA